MSLRGRPIAASAAVTLALVLVGSGTVLGHAAASPTSGDRDPVSAAADRVPSTPAAKGKGKKKRADLDLVATDAHTSGGELYVTFLVKNKGRTTAAATESAIYMSIDATKNRNDVLVGKLKVPSLAKKQKTVVTGTLPVPIRLSPSVYHVVACADTSKRVKERSENNNCRGTPDYMLTPAVVRVDVSAGGKVTTSGVSGGGCNGTLCGFEPGQGAVTFTPKPDPGNRFVGWSGCVGYQEGPDRSITFTAVGTSRTCQATFKTVAKLQWSAKLKGTLASGTVTASAGPDVTCKAAGASSGTCTFDAGVGEVVLTASPFIVTTSFVGWTDGPGGPCNGVKNGTQITLTSPAASQDCVAVFKSVI